MTVPSISVLTTMFGVEPYVDEFYRRTRVALEKVSDDYEIVFVDDGSPDNSKQRVLKLIEEDPKVRLIELSRNFGQHKAIMAGLAHVRGDRVFLIDADLEEDPALLEEFHTIMEESDEVDLVYGYMEKRPGPIFARLSGAVFYRLMNLMSDLPIPKNPMAARLMTRSYVDALLQFRESHVWLAGIMALSGYKQIGVPCEKTHKGSSSYTLSRKITLALDALISFTNKPLTFVAGSGILMSVASLAISVYLFSRALSSDAEIAGWMLVLASVWFLGGLILSAIGLVGFYVGRIFLQVKQRPNAIVRKIYN